MDRTKEDNSGGNEDGDVASSGQVTGEGNTSNGAAKGDLWEQQPAKKKRQAVTCKVYRKRANTAEDDGAGNKSDDE